MFKTLNSLTKPSKFPNEDKIQKINSFVMVKWLSNNPKTVIAANAINLNDKIPIQNQFRFLDDYFTLNGTKKQKPYVPWTKKQNVPDVLQKLLDNIQRFYKVNPDTAREYFELMDNDQRDRLYNMYE